MDKLTSASECQNTHYNIASVCVQTFLRIFQDVSFFGGSFDAIVACIHLAAVFLKVAKPYSGHLSDVFDVIKAS